MPGKFCVHRTNQNVTIFSYILVLLILTAIPAYGQLPALTNGAIRLTMDGGGFTKKLMSTRSG